MADILKQNKIPGREQLTRPDEISALSKYLGNIRKIQDAHTKLEDRILEVKGRGDKASFPDITELDNRVDSLEVTSDLKLDNSTSAMPSDELAERVSSLDDTVISGDVVEKATSLDDYIHPILEGHKTVNELDSTVVDQVSNENPGISKLDDSVTIIEDQQKVSGLDTLIVRRSDNKKDEVSSLDDSTTTLSVNKLVESLDEKKVGLDVQVKTNNLNTYVENLQGDTKVSELTEYVENLVDNKGSGVSSLDESVTDLVVSNKIDSLDNSKTILETTNVDSLDDNVTPLVVTNIDELNDYVRTISQNYNENDIVELDDFVAPRTYNFGKNVSELDGDVIDLYAEDKVTELDSTVGKLNIESPVDWLDRKKLRLKNVEEKVSDLDNEVEILNNVPTSIALDDEVLELEVKKLAVALRSGDDTEILNAVEKIEKLTSGSITLPEDKLKTEIKDLLLELEQLPPGEDEESALIQLFGKVITLFNEYGGEKNPWSKKITMTLTSAFFSENRGDNIKHISPFDRIAGPSDDSRGRYYRFCEKLQEVTDIADLSIWESATDGVTKELIRDNGEIKNKEGLIKERSGRDPAFVPSYKLPNHRMPNLGSNATIKSVISELSGGHLDISGTDYVRFGVETAADAANLRGDLRKHMIKESLRAAMHIIDEGKKALGLDPGRLPGSEIDDSKVKTTARHVVGGLKKAASFYNNTDSLASALRGSIGSVMDLVNGTALPKNRPGAKFGVKKAQEKYERGNSRKRIVDKGISTAIWDLICSRSKSDFIFSEIENDDSKYINFADNYIHSEGIQTTLMDLCGIEGTSLPSTFEDLQKILRESPYITTPGKFTNTRDGRCATQTLSVTNYWEILIEPFCHKDLNGNFSYLPAIQEINLMNQKKHGVNTGYSSWIPFTGFDMTLSKMNTKSVGLYEGEIVYPISNELTNELRITIADDIYKSWAWYWKTVADVSVYSSIPHNAAYYKGKSQYYPIIPTFVDRTCHCVALYKNITFRIRIYVFTPQYSTIKSFDLLCVLKDWSSSYVGDIDTSGGADISLSFCVVGENPDKYVPPVDLLDPSTPVEYKPEDAESYNWNEGAANGEVDEWEAETKEIEVDKKDENGNVVKDKDGKVVKEKQTEITGYKMVQQSTAATNRSTPQFDFKTYLSK